MYYVWLVKNPSLQKNYNYNTYYSQPLQTTKEKIIYIYIQDSFLCQMRRKSNKMEKNDNKVEKKILTAITFGNFYLIDIGYGIGYILSKSCKEL